jgi:hypothetical protein
MKIYAKYLLIFSQLVFEINLQPFKTEKYETYHSINYFGYNDYFLSTN